MKYKYLLVLVVFLLPTKLLSFPEMVRYGYSNCSSCHVSPNGGGILTEYGKRLSEEALSTWSREGESEFLNNLISLPSWLLLGGDLRFIGLKNEYDIKKPNQFIFMQLDKEVALSYKDITLEATFGIYNETKQARRHYVKYTPSENWSLRLGKFMPIYGILTPEHETSTRRGLGWNQGAETYNAEVVFMKERGEIALTGISKYDGEKNLKNNGVSLRVALYLLTNSVLGWSGYYGQNDSQKKIMSGPFAIFGFTERAYLLSDLSLAKSSPLLSKSSNEQKPGVYTYHRFGYEFYRGIHTSFVYDLSLREWDKEKTKKETIGPSLAFYPRPHFELTASWFLYRNLALSSEWKNLANMMFHYYF